MQASGHTSLPSSASTRPHPKEARVLLLAVTGAVLAAQFVPMLDLVFFPLRILTTFVHESSHALAALLTGGSVRQISIDLAGNGITATSGGFGPIIYMAGYVGTIGTGGASILLQRRPGMGRKAFAIGAALILTITLLWIRPLQDPWGFVAGAALSFMMAAGARYLSENWARTAAVFLGVELCLNAVFDLRNLIWMATGSNTPNDAVLMAAAYGGPAWFWAVCWAAIAGIILVSTFAAYWRR